MKKTLLTGLLIATVFTGCIKQPTPECKQAEAEYAVGYIEFLKESESITGYNTLTESTLKMCRSAVKIKQSCEQNEDVDNVLTMCNAMKNKGK